MRHGGNEAGTDESRCRCGEAMSGHPFGDHEPETLTAGDPQRRSFGGDASAWEVRREVARREREGAT
jgi:hypothetical protein